MDMKQTSIRFSYAALRNFVYIWNSYITRQLLHASSGVFLCLFAAKGTKSTSNWKRISTKFPVFFRFLYDRGLPLVIFFFRSCAQNAYCVLVIMASLNFMQVYYFYAKKVPLSFFRKFSLNWNKEKNSNNNNEKK